MIRVDCHELTRDEQLAIASELSDALAGRAVALVDDHRLVLDSMRGPEPDVAEIEAIVRSYISRRPKAAEYSIDRAGDVLTVRSPDPIAATHGQRRSPLPDNLKQCPFCSFVTPYDELLTVHVRSHGFT